MTGFGQEAWLAAGRSLLAEPIPAEAYMDVLKERLKVYRKQPREAVEVPWITPLLEWFCWPEDNDLVILPDRTTEEPKPKPPAPTREDLIAKRDALQSRLDRLTAPRDKAMPARRHDTDGGRRHGRGLRGCLVASPRFWC